MFLCKFQRGQDHGPIVYFSFSLEVDSYSSEHGIAFSVLWPLLGPLWFSHLRRVAPVEWSH